MSITVRIESEGGKPLGDLWCDLRANRVLVRDHSGTCCLRFIDAYGDTVFNQQQVPVLLEELELLRSRLSDREEAQIVEGLLAFVKPASNRLHVYVRFIGD